MTTSTTPAAVANTASTSPSIEVVASNLAALTRPDFPLLAQTACLGQPLIYLDYAATSQKPRQVLAALQHYYDHDNANVHRGAHQLSARATDGFEAARAKVAAFIGAASAREIVFTRNASEAINLVARSWGDANLGPGDEVLLTVMEHHSNLVPWQLLAARTGCVLRHAGLTETGELDLDDLRSQITERTKLVSLVQVSNTLGCLNPIEQVAALAHAAGALVLVDACQSLPHLPLNVAALRADFLVGSSHKLCGPTGMGFLWAREALLEAMPPFLGGGEMIQDVYLDHSSWADLPHKFEAGTPAIAEAIGMGAALDYLSAIGLERIHAWEQQLTRQLFERLQAIEGVRILGPTPEQQPDRGALAAFTVDGLHANDIAALLDSAGICIRSGHHCTQPLHRLYGLPGSARASLGFTTTPEEIDRFAEELEGTITFLREHS
ncbi:MAG: SufS family cysteine desulfurase [Prochlorococcaceae cyanobacterium MAG_34]|jgi:cysteine desulfurase / selenocysteine lyase|uniref:SufS family cysteine desulfurase n=1 Tax=Cyanobium sp. TaxID=2164130 RepID=UPI00071549F8|nr:MAG: cysteine desulfurase [cyanobacterium BACL30 MAG-120619-bin27]MDP4737916.1 SufS family cysteine desulfurase [Cyanobium sp. MAG_216]MDP4808127.1 SufS family cysteine desulfurase [Cyanobium sp. MAG_160]MDP4830216.1 SufS family cysteine desulfurase [Cyanobium sp. MAG_185]MDP4882082.1 SufS family cysteine desulfurase [Cyanobium sp. MAG_137]MDP5118119.1 SufS family cysteine desulfurase [Prochlorococcaceae cyanobacterium MAG_34]